MTLTDEALDALVSLHGEWTSRHDAGGKDALDAFLAVQAAFLDAGPALVAEVKALRAERDRLRDEMADFKRDFRSAAAELIGHVADIAGADGYLTHAARLLSIKQELENRHD